MFAGAVLSSFREGIEGKLYFLFCLYDLNNSQGISFSELLAVVTYWIIQLLTSPETELKDVLSNDAFLDTLTTQEMSYYLLASNKLDLEGL
jgi:Ca2+-binding EF-hand superfamily protein